MKVLVCGDRNWTDKALIKERLQDLTQVEFVMHGGARGADRLAGEAANDLGFRVDEFPALWHFSGKSAGMARNRRMLEMGNPDLVQAFHDDIDHSRGTKGMVALARRAGIKTHVISHSSKEGY